MPELPAGLFLILSLAVFLVTYVKILGKQHSKQEDETEKARFASFKIIQGAIKKAQAIIGEAEIEGIKVAAQNRVEGRKIEEHFEQQLETFSGRLDRIQTDYSAYLDSLRTSVNSTEEKNRQIIEVRLSQIFDKLEQSLVESFNQTQQQSIHTIEMEIRSARQLIEQYKLQQLKLIDENIISLLETTMSLVIAKKLSLKDQMDMVYEALEKAKVEKFIV